MPVAGVDPLTAHADDRAQRGKERGAAVAVSKRRVAASDLNDVSGWPHSDGRQAAPDRVSRSPRWRGGRGNEQVRTGQRGGRVGLGSPPDRGRRLNDIVPRLLEEVPGQPAAADSRPTAIAHAS